MMKRLVRLAPLLLGTFLVTTSFGAPGLGHKPLAGRVPVGERPNTVTQYNITDYGAVGDGKTLNTKMIQQVIDKCDRDGAELIIPKGVFLTGALYLKPNLHIKMQDGAVLKGSTDIKDYPAKNTRIEGHFESWPSALLNGDKVDHLRITGPGTLDGSGEPFWKEFYRRRTQDNKTTNLNVPRPRLAFFQDAKDIEISGISFKNSGFWNLHLFRCQQVSVENCRFEAPSESKPDHHAPSSDGIDVDCSQDITISKCFFSVGDDCIALKGNKGPFAMQDSTCPPVERIHISDCEFEAGGGIMTCGSEATIVRDITIERCITHKPTVLRLKLRPDTPQQYENITLNDITMEGTGAIFSIKPWNQYFDLKGQKPPTSIVRNITISNIKGSAVSLGEIIGNPTTSFGKIVLKNAQVTLSSEKANIKDAKDLLFDDVSVGGKPLSVEAVIAANKK